MVWENLDYKLHNNLQIVHKPVTTALDSKASNRYDVLEQDIREVVMLTTGQGPSDKSSTSLL